MKKCSNKNCKEKNPIFGKNKTKKDGFNNQCKDCVKKYSAQRYTKNKDNILIKNKKWRKENCEHMTHLHVKWVREHREQAAKTRKSHRLKNLDKARIRDRAITSKRRAWKRNVPSDGSTMHDLIKLNPKLICYLCDKEITGDIHIDHVMPLSKGGHDTIDNKKLTHPFCNMSKGAKIIKR